MTLPRAEKKIWHADRRKEHGREMITLAKSSSIAAIRQRLDDDGYCVIVDALDAADLALVRQALDRVTEQDDAAGAALRYGPDGANQRVWALLNRGDEFVRLAMHPLGLEIVRTGLGPDALLSMLSANVTGPGGDRDIGRLHTDQGFLDEPWPYQLATNVAFFLDDFTDDNGATLVVPGSHKSLVAPDHGLAPDAPVRLTGKAGSMAIWDGRLHHATGLNRTDQRRRGIFATYCRPFMRTQENWTRSLDPRLLKAYPGLAAMTGFEEWQTLGGVNGPRQSGLNF
jgi:ectoine hydroxylase-related dioxygenase (phytanoyl-CoA dioxygenase family)